MLLAVSHLPFGCYGFAGGWVAYSAVLGSCGIGDAEMGDAEQFETRGAPNAVDGRGGEHGLQSGRGRSF